MSNFQLAITIFFSVFAIIAILIFTGVLPGLGSDTDQFGGEVVLWGTFPSEALGDVLEEVNREQKDLFLLTYVEKNPDTYEEELVDALASGSGPDIFILPQDLLAKHEDKAFIIPQVAVPERTFKDLFIDEGNMLLVEGGTLGMPLVVDPLVMYWNKWLFSASRIAREPRSWDEFLAIAPLISKVDKAGNVTTSAVALGEFNNIAYAKEIISALVLQTGNPITRRGAYGIEVVFGRSDEGQKARAESSVRFYTEFSNPSKKTYSWNRALPLSRDAFIAEDLAIYFGRASEYEMIAAKNPHLNFAIAPLPQIKDTKTPLTFGTLYSLVIAKNSSKTQTAFNAAFVLSGDVVAPQVAEALGMAPAQRGPLGGRQEKAEREVSYESALISRGWLDSDSQRSYTIFKDMITDISSGRFRLEEAIGNAASELSALAQPR